MKGKLELTWAGKDEPFLIEPRILLYDEKNSYGAQDTGNMLIYGDNLLALKALEKRYAGKVKCIYIDPPYNAKATNEFYDDNFEHSFWLNLMKSRLQILWNLLAPDGLLAVQIDDSEYAYLFLMMTEICSIKKMKTICVKMSEATGVKMASVNKTKSIPKLKEYIILAKKNGINGLELEKIPKSGWDKEYKTYCENISDNDLKKIKIILNDDNRTKEDIDYVDNAIKNIKFRNIREVAKDMGEKANETWCFKHADRIVRSAALTGGARDIAIAKKNTFKNIPSAFSVETSQKKLYLIKGDFNTNSQQSRCKILFADEYLTVNPGDLWTDIKTTGLDNEGGVDFRNGKKPERLVYRIIKMSTNPGDLVLDSFLGSGTTAAVAHKMNRRYIGIEMGEHAYTHCKTRLDRVIDGTDAGGITKAVNWQGGGGYCFYKLASTLVNIDSHGEPIISKEYNAEQLAAAVALHEGYTYSPDPKCFWKQAKGSNNSYLFVTTQAIDLPYLDIISKEMKPGEYLTIAATTLPTERKKRYRNISLKYIPQMLLKKCKFGVTTDYELPIIEPPKVEEEEDEG